MHKARLKLGIVTFLASLAGALVSPFPAKITTAAGGIQVTESRVEHSFAQHVTFTLEATSAANITEVYLFFHAVHDEETEETQVPLETPAREISVQYVHDVRRYPLPPFADITYWWQVEDADGHQLKTESNQFKYTDNRFSWEHLSDGGITIPVSYTHLRAHET